MKNRKKNNIIRIATDTVAGNMFALLNNLRVAYCFAFALFFIALSFSVPAHADTSCQKASCSEILKNCKPNLNILASKNALNSTCLAESAKDGCFNPVPVGCTVNYGGVGNRPNGAGGNKKPRYHLGNDIGSNGCANAPGKNYKFINVYAAADGTVAYNNTGGCAGRTVAINHDKKCTLSGGDKPQYKTIYRHLLQSRVTLGQSVKKGDVIGIMGGSNASAIGASPCDNPAQKDAPGYQHTAAACSAAAAACGGASSYDIHMHFEFVDGGLASGSGSGIKGQALYKPDCDDTQSLCGGCPTNAGSCNSGVSKGYADGSSGDLNGSYSVDVGTGNAGNGVIASSCSFSQYLDSSKCVFCGLFRTMFNTASQVALMADKGLLAPTLNLVKIGFLIWLAVYLLKQLASFSATNSGELTKGILFQGFRVAVVALILSSTSSLFYVMDLTLNPVMMTGLNFVQNLTPSSSDGYKGCNKEDEYMKGIKGYSTQGGYASESATGGLSTEVGEAIVCSIKKMEDATGILMTLGKFSCCLGWENKWARVFPDLRYITTGMLLWLAGLILLLTFPWCLVDCVLQLCIAAAMVPCAIGAYAFKITSKYLKIIWDFFMNAMFNFVFMALIVYVINKQLESWLGIKLTDGTEPEHEIFIRASDGLAWYGKGFVRVASICFFCFVFFDEAKAMAEKFASSPGLGGNKGIGRMVGGVAAGAATSGLKSSIQVAGRAVSSGANMVAGNRFRSMRNHAVGIFASKLGKNTVGTDGKKIQNEGSFRLFGRDIKFSATQGEDGRWSLTREVHKRSKTDKVFEKVLDKNGNEMKDENGNTIYQARKRFLGIKSKKAVTMVAHEDEDGNLVYTSVDDDISEDGEPKFKFTMNENGEISSYKTRFTRSYLGLGKAVEKGNIKQYGVNRTINTATSRTREKLDTQGNVTDSEFKMQSFSFFNRDLVRKDGTINIDTFNEMQKSIGNPKHAAQALVAQVMEKRGLKLDSKYADRKIDIDDEGRVTIHQTQKDEDGNIINTQNIQAVMIGDQMFIAVENTDAAGNITLNESNGIFRTVQTATKGKDGKYTYNFEGNFSDYVMNKNKYQSPLNFNGQWGNNIDRDKAMAGFSQAHYDKYLAKLQLKQMGRTMSSGEFNNSNQAKQLHSMLHTENLDNIQSATKNMTYEIEASQKDFQYNKNPSDDDRLPDDLKSDVKDNLTEIKEIHEELEKEHTIRDNLEKEQNELKEKENKSEEEEERIKRELEESQKKIEELNKKQKASEDRKMEIDDKIRKWKELYDNEDKNRQHIEENKYHTKMPDKD